MEERYLLRFKKLISSIVLNPVYLFSYPSGSLTRWLTEFSWRSSSLVAKDSLVTKKLKSGSDIRGFIAVVLRLEG